MAEPDESTDPSGDDEPTTTPDFAATDETLQLPPAGRRRNATTDSGGSVTVGSVLGNYRLTRVLGRGGMGVVYEAVDEVLDRPVALKILPAPIMNDPKPAARLLREARAVARMNHPNIVHIYDIEPHQGGYYLVLEYVDGGSMADAVADGPLPWREAVHAGIEACKGLAAAHAKGLIHRDIKPANLLRTRDGVVKITDFGLAKAPGPDTSGLTAADKVVGTPSFMSPEQCQQEPLDLRTDIYSMGATLFALVTGRGPYDEAGSPTKVMFAHCYAGVPDARQMNPAIPEALVQVLRCALAKEPEDRYQDVDAMRADLEAVYGGEPTEAAGKTYSAPIVPTALSPGPTDHERRPVPPVAGDGGGSWLGRREWLIVPAALAGLAAILGLMAWMVVNFGPRGPLKSSETDDPAPSAPFSNDPLEMANGGDSIRLGLVVSATGPLSLTEGSVLKGALLGIEELNRRGGVLGRQLESIRRDGASDPEQFAAEAARLIDEARVPVVFGAWSPACRKAMREVVEARGSLLVHPAPHEGLENSPNILYTGALPNQLVLPAVNWAYGSLGREFALIGVEDTYSAVTHKLIANEVGRLGGKLVVNRMLPTMSQAEIRNVVAEVKEARPSAIFNTMPGGGYVLLAPALRKAGIASSSMPTVSFRVDSTASRFAGGQATAGDYLVRSYFASADDPWAAGREFAIRYQRRYADEPTAGAEAAYVGVLLWASAAEAAKSVEPQAVRKALLGRKLDDAPEGAIRVDDKSLQLWKFARGAEVASDGRLVVVLRPRRPKPPIPFPPPLTESEWESFLDQLRQRWGGAWQGPGMQ